MLRSPITDEPDKPDKPDKFKKLQNLIDRRVGKPKNVFSTGTDSGL